MTRLASHDNKSWYEPEGYINSFLHDVPVTIILQKLGLSPEELQQRRAELLNKQQLELSDLDRKLSEEERDVKKGALVDWEVKFARANLDLKEKHYKVRVQIFHKSEKFLLIQKCDLFENSLGCINMEDVPGLYFVMVIEKYRYIMVVNLKA